MLPERASAADRRADVGWAPLVSGYGPGEGTGGITGLGRPAGCEHARGDEQDQRDDEYEHECADASAAEAARRARFWRVPND